VTTRDCHGRAWKSPCLHGPWAVEAQLPPIRTAQTSRRLRYEAARRAGKLEVEACSLAAVHQASTAGDKQAARFRSPLAVMRPALGRLSSSGRLAVTASGSNAVKADQGRIRPPGPSPA